jgi:ATP-binding cassette subfamily A (ABC1) protein 3
MKKIIIIHTYIPVELGLIQFSHLWQSIGYFLLTLGWELLPFHKLTPVGIKQYWRSIMNLQHDTHDLEPLLKSPSETVDLNFDEDIDVQTERNRVLAGSIDNAIIYLRNLRKVFPICFL